MRRVYGFFWLPFARLHGISLARTTNLKDFRGFPGMELGIFRVAKSSGEGRAGGRGMCSIDYPSRLSAERVGWPVERPLI